MSEAVVISLIAAVAPTLVALVALLQLRQQGKRIEEVNTRTIVFEVKLNHELDEMKRLVGAASAAEGRIQGAEEARASDGQARLDRATAAALVLDPVPHPVAPKEE